MSTASMNTEPTGTDSTESGSESVTAEPTPQAHYFSEQPSGRERRKSITVTVWGRDLSVITANGVFSSDALDRGTAVLLAKSPIPQGPRRILDLGCGYGVVALALATHAPELIIDAVDINDRALGLCRDNAEASGVSDRITTLRPEQADSAIRYDEIWSNPPIRIGKSALHALLLDWLPRLAPDGVARLVVSKNLGADTLQRWLGEQGYDCTRRASDKGFRVLEVRHGV